MSHLICSMSDYTEQIKKDREKRNKRRHVQYFYHKCLSNNPVPFIKPTKKLLRTKKPKTKTNKPI